MLPTNLTAITFDELKSSIKSYMRTRPEFTDYDFEGSTLSYLVDVLAYNTYYNAFNANMALNEIFINSASSRDNVVNIAKLLNYVPHSYKCSQGCVNLEIQVPLENGQYPMSVTLKKGPVAAGGQFTFVRQSDRTVSVNAQTGTAFISDCLLYEGAILNYSYVVNDYQKQRFLIPADQVDTSTLIVRVRANQQSANSDTYNLVDNIVNLNSDSRVYFLNEVEDSRYEIKFGDGILGRKLVDNEIVEIEYIRTSGSAANDINTLTFMGELYSNTGNLIGSNNVTLTNVYRTRYGDENESTTSIKYNAPKYYSTQYRAVTADDYSLITKKVYQNAESVTAYGGEELSPPIYGKVFIAIKTKNNTKLNKLTKQTIKNNLKPYAMAAIEPVITDPDYMYVITDIFSLYDKNCTSISETEMASKISVAVAQFAGQSLINNFGGSFSLSKLQKAIELADECIDTSAIQATLLRYLNPNMGQTNTYCVDFGTALYDSNPSNSGDCPKEPILKSGAFRTLEYPYVDQYFEDDGFGRLQTYYNSGTEKVYTNTEAGYVNYSTGRICFGPVNVIATPNVDVDVSDFGGNLQLSVGGQIIPLGAPGPELQIPLQVIPSNFTTITPATPGTILALPIPAINVAPLGTTPPPVIPINNLTPELFLNLPTLIEPIIPDLSGSFFDLDACF